MLWLLTCGPVILTNNKSQLLITIRSAYQYEMWSRPVTCNRNIPEFCPYQLTELASTAKIPDPHMERKQCIYRFYHLFLPCEELALGKTGLLGPVGIKVHQ